MYSITQKEDKANMRMLRRVEEIRYPSQTLQVDHNLLRPTIMQVSMMEDAYINHDIEGTDVFVDLVEREGIHFLLIYIWNTELRNDFRQLVCSPGYRLTEEEEELLVSVCLDENARIRPNLLISILNEYDTICPHTNIRLYTERPLLTLLHMYSCLFPGIRELLFKANLPYIAGVIHAMEGLNVFPVMKKGTPADIFGKGFTKKLLRYMNSEWGIQELLTEEKRQVALDTYKAFHKRLGGYSTISHSQWLYLKYCHKDTTRFDLQKFRFFGKDKTDRLFQDYIIFLAKTRIINRYIAWERDFSDVEELYRSMAEADCILQYISNRDEYDQHMWFEKNRLQYLDYNDEKSEYVVTHPCTVQDIFDEGRKQANCLIHLYRDICEGNMDVGFMRTKEEPDKSFITFEVIDGEVIQVLGKYNHQFEPFSKEMRWFKDVYMREKKFVESPGIPGWIDGPFGNRGQREGILGELEDIPF